MKSYKVIYKSNTGEWCEQIVNGQYDRDGLVKSLTSMGC